MANNQSDGKHKLKRIEFVFNGKSYKFVLNPEEYSQPEDNRFSVTHTKAGAWGDEFGPGIPSIQMKGTTGLKNGTVDPTSGFKKFKELRDMIRSVYSRVKPGQVVPSNKELKFYNYTDDDHWIVVPRRFELHRSVSRPLLYVYNIELLCMRKPGDPNPNDISGATIKAGTRKIGG
jgi:hypothetical protein